MIEVAPVVVFRPPSQGTAIVNQEFDTASRDHSDVVPTIVVEVTHNHIGKSIITGIIPERVKLRQWIVSRRWIEGIPVAEDTVSASKKEVKIAIMVVVACDDVPRCVPFP